MLSPPTDFVRLWEGSSRATDPETTYTLDDSVLNYKAILIVFKTNDQYCTELVPYNVMNSYIVGHHGITKFVWLNSPGGKQALPWKFAAYCTVSFPTTTTFTVALTWNDDNLKLGVHAIYGLT